MKKFITYINEVLESLDIYTNVNSKPKAIKSPKITSKKDKLLEEK